MAFHAAACRRLDEHDRCADRGDLTLELGRRALRVQRHGDSAESEDGKVRLDEVQPVAAQQGDSIAAVRHRVGPSHRAHGRPVAQLAVAGLDTATDDRHVVGRVPLDDACEIHAALQPEQADDTCRQDQQQEKGQGERGRRAHRRQPSGHAA